MAAERTDVRDAEGLGLLGVASLILGVGPVLGVIAPYEAFGARLEGADRGEPPWFWLAAIVVAAGGILLAISIRNRGNRIPHA